MFPGRFTVPPNTECVHLSTSQINRSGPCSLRAKAYMPRACYTDYSLTLAAIESIVQFKWALSCLAAGSCRSLGTPTRSRRYPRHCTTASAFFKRDLSSPNQSHAPRLLLAASVPSKRATAVHCSALLTCCSKAMLGCAYGSASGAEKCLPGLPVALRANFVTAS
jgi:hypothetical protein